MILKINKFVNIQEKTLTFIRIFIYNFVYVFVPDLPSMPQDFLCIYKVKFVDLKLNDDNN